MNAEISILDVFNNLKKWAWIIMASGIVGSLVFYFSVEMFTEESYRSEAQLIVNQKQSGEIIQYNEIQTNVSLINTYRQIILGKAVLEQVINQLDSPLTVGELQASITVQQIDDAQTFNIISELKSPVLAQEVVQVTIEVFEEILTEIYDNDVLNVFVLSSPSYEPDGVSSNSIERVVYGAITGMAIAGMYLFFKEKSDNRLKNDLLLVQLGLIKLGEIETLNDQEFSNSMYIPKSSATKNK